MQSGGEVSLIESFAAWSLVRLLGSIPIVPGGFGIVELGLTGALVGFGGANAEVVAAVIGRIAVPIVSFPGLGVPTMLTDNRPAGSPVGSVAARPRAEFANARG